MLCVTCAEEVLLLGNLWQEGGVPVVTEVRFSFPVMVTVQSYKIPIACVRVFDVRNIRGFLQTPVHNL